MKRTLNFHEIIYKTQHPNPRIKIGSTVYLAYLDEKEQDNTINNAYKCWGKIFTIQAIELYDKDWMCQIKYKGNSKDKYIKKVTDLAFFIGRFELIPEFKQLEIL